MQKKFRSIWYEWQCWHTLEMFIRIWWGNKNHLCVVKFEQQRHDCELKTCSPRTSLARTLAINFLCLFPFHLSFEGIRQIEMNKFSQKKTRGQSPEDLNHLFDSITAHQCEHRLCVLSQRIESNPHNKSHPSLCYCNTNYIIGSSSWRHAWHCRKMCARKFSPPLRQASWE